MKIRKEDRPITPKMNWMNAPSYKLTNHLFCNLEQHAPLLYFTDVRNIVPLLTHLKDIKFHTGLKFLPFDIKKFYTHVLFPPLPP